MKSALNLGCVQRRGTRWSTRAALFLVLFSYWFAAGNAVTAAERRRVIIDEDAFGPGRSNLQAILLLLQSPDVEVLGITIESGDGWRDENVAHTLRMLELIGRTDVPVVPGATWPLVNNPEATKRWEARYGKLFYKGAWTETWPSTARRPPYHPPEVVPPMSEGEPTTKALNETATAFMIRHVRAHPHEVTLLALGPVTSIALAVRLDDGFAGLAKELVFMGGSFRPSPAGNEFALEYINTPRLEFNFRWDPEATRIVLHAPWSRLTQIPVDPTTKTLFTPELQRRSSASETRVARYVAQYAQTFPMWDELAAAVWLDPTLVTRSESVAVDVDTDGGAGYGNTLSWPAGKGPGLGERDATVVFEVDVPRLEQFVVDRLNQPEVATPK